MTAVKTTQLMVGMEIHVELATRTKMFSRSANLAHPDHYGADPNTLLDPVVAGLPGALPVMNRRAVEMSMMVGKALDCEISTISKWDRKNYFYPDLPKGYQISQFDQPLCLNGHLEITRPDGSLKRVGIIRAHLEEDTGKLGHETPDGVKHDGSLVDLNRAGTPLLEIVTEPDLTSADDAVLFAQELRNICCFLGVTGGIMQRGHMRFEPNINVIITTDDGVEHATPIVEIKNLNSFRAVRAAIEFEQTRQIKQWQEDGVEMGPGQKTTRGWDDDQLVTVLQREKEDAHDYRYFPEPDLVPVHVNNEWIDQVASELPELPIQRRLRYQDSYGLPKKDAAALTGDYELCCYFETCTEVTLEQVGSLKEAEAAQTVAKWLLNAGAKRANETGQQIHELGITSKQMSQIIALRQQDDIGSSAANALFILLCEKDEDAQAIAEQNGLLQVKDDSQLDSWIDAAIQQQPQAAADFSEGKDAAMGRLVGAIMKESKGQADAKVVSVKLRERLRS